MKIFIACSKHFYNKIPDIRRELELAGHIITLPNSFDKPLMEEEMKKLEPEKYIAWKSKMLRRDESNILPNDAILVLNFEKNGQENYIGGATFMEIAKAWELNKKIYLLNPIPKSIFTDELIGINPIILGGNLKLIK